MIFSTYHDHIACNYLFGYIKQIITEHMIFTFFKIIDIIA